MLRSVTATRYVTPLREGGSLPGLVEADDDGLYVLKFRGAGQGVKALVAEVIAGELARALGLTVPEIVTVEVDPQLGAAEPDPEIQELITGSEGTNVGLDFLPGALPFNPAAGPLPSPELAADIDWLDALVLNVDRTPRNPNLLCWHHRLWLIDHGAALFFHHRDWSPEADAASPFAQIADHVLLPHAGSIDEAHERLAPKVTLDVIQAAVDKVPAEWLDGGPPAVGGAAPAAASPALRYTEFLCLRLEGREFAREAERARG
jgi:hypothetical protein